MGFFTKLLGLDGALYRPAGPPAADAGPHPDPDSVSPESFQRQVETVLEAVRPALRADGGDIRLVGVSGRSAKVKLLGACQGCHSATLTLQLGIEQRLRKEIPGFEDLIPV